MRSAFLACLVCFTVQIAMVDRVVAEPLNVLFIAADDLRNDLGCYGHPQVKTPNLNRLAARGMVFNRAYCQQAVCNPSRASVMTGKRPSTLGIYDLPTHFREVDPDVVTLPQHFKNNGYFTQNIGKVFHNWRQKQQGDAKSWSVPAVLHYARHDDDKPMVKPPLPKNLAKAPRCMCLDVPDEAYFDGRIADLAVKSLQQQAANKKPFFLGVGFWKPHLPFNAPKKYWDLYDRQSISEIPNPDKPTDVPAIALHDSREIMRAAGKDGLSHGEIQELRHGYLAGISFLDAQVGKVIDELDRLKLSDNTVIVFWSDHGFHLGEQSLWAKTSNFELDARVPLIIARPKSVSTQAGTKTNALAELLDLYPTLVETCGLPDVPELEGVSLVPVLNDPKQSVKEAAFTQHPRPAYFNGEPAVMGVSVRTDEFRYTEWRDFKTGVVQDKELYYHTVDPLETRNVIARPPANAPIAKLRRLLNKAIPRRQLEPHRVTYNSPNLHVDLGVGLWAWPMPMDWDKDGDLDLVVSCPDVPYAGTYFFENPGSASDGSKTKLPIFKPGVLVGPKISNATASYVDGQVRILSRNLEFTGLPDSLFKKTRKIFPKDNIHGSKIRANQWRYVDYDGDKDLDLVVGVGDWNHYGWDNAYNALGEWQRGPLHGYVYVMTNNGSTKSPKYSEPVKLRTFARSLKTRAALSDASGTILDVYGMPSPNFADFDGDKDLDLICGEFLDGFNYFENIGTRTSPVYANGRKLQYQNKPLAMDLQMIVPVAVDWDSDGDTDMIVGDEDGRVAFVEHTGRIIDGVPSFKPPVYFQQEARDVKFGALVTPVSVDWDADGDDDLVCGNTAGYIGFIENIADGNPPRWAAPKRLEVDGKPIRIQAGPTGSIQGPCEAKWGYTTIDVADWNHDGLLDIVANSIWGKVEWFENVGKAGSPKLSKAQPVLVDWPAGTTPPKPAWNWWNPKHGELSTQWRTTPVVRDINNDQMNDLVMLDHQGYLAFFERKKTGRLKPGQRIFLDKTGKPLRLNDREAGRSGRRKLCFADWDGDGKIDLLANSRSIDLYRNISTKESPWTFADPVSLDNRRLAGHTTSPTIVDWNQDGKPELLIGAEDGRLYYQPNK
jgi:arylsulfatase A-like enzyme